MNLIQQTSLVSIVIIGSSDCLVIDGIWIIRVEISIVNWILVYQLVVRSNSSRNSNQLNLKSLKSNIIISQVGNSDGNVVFERVELIDLSVWEL